MSIDQLHSPSLQPLVRQSVDRSVHLNVGSIGQSKSQSPCSQLVRQSVSQAADQLDGRSVSQVDIQSVSQAASECVSESVCYSWSASLSVGRSVCRSI